MVQLKIVNSIVEDGIMTDSDEFFPDISQQERKQRFDDRINCWLKKHKLENYQVVIPDQKMRYGRKNNYNDYEDGSYMIITEDNLEKYRKNHKYFHTDILLLKSNLKNIIIADKVSDCPILFLWRITSENIAVMAVAHVGAEYVDRNLPSQMVEVFEKETQISSQDVKAYISVCITEDSFCYDGYPYWATNNEVWRDYIKKKQDKYYIDIRGAIKEQLLKSGLVDKNIEIDPRDTRYNDDFFSNCASKNENEEKAGRFLVGAYFEES